MAMGHEKRKSLGPLGVLDEQNADFMGLTNLDDFETTGEVEFIEKLLEFVGKLLAIDNDHLSDELNKKEWSSLDHTYKASAHIRRTLGLDYVNFIRTLLGVNSWKNIITGVVIESLQKGADIINTKGNY